MKRKVTIMMPLLLIIAILLAGCGSEPETSTTAKVTNESVTTVAPTFTEAPTTTEQTTTAAPTTTEQMTTTATPTTTEQTTTEEPHVVLKDKLLRTVITDVQEPDNFGQEKSSEVVELNYSYEESGNLIEITFEKELTWGETWVGKYSFEYEEGNLTKVFYYDFGDLLAKTILEYDSSNRIVKRTKYGFSGILQLIPQSLTSDGNIVFDLNGFLRDISGDSFSSPFPNNGSDPEVILSVSEYQYDEFNRITFEAYTTFDSHYEKKYSYQPENNSITIEYTTDRGWYNLIYVFNEGQLIHYTLKRDERDESYYEYEAGNLIGKKSGHYNTMDDPNEELKYVRVLEFENIYGDYEVESKK